MNTSTENGQKERILKTLAVGGFIGLIIIIAWLGVQLIRVMPNAFTSLASLADTVYNHEEIEIEVVSSKNIADTGETFGVSWNLPRTPGDFTFTYDCADGIAVDIRTIGGNVESVTCDTETVIGHVSGIDMQVASEKNHFTDVTYSIAYVPAGTDEAVAVTDGAVTIVNPAILEGTTITVVTPPIEPSTPAVTTPSTKPSTPTPAPKPATAKPTTPKPATKPVYTYTIPVSNPNGFTDITTKLISVGTLVGGKFVTNGVITGNNSGAILFEIKNIGTKTSNTFTYSVQLPNGTTYTSPLQEALKPNERITAAIGIDTANQSGTKPFTVTVTNASETVLTNNSFSGTVLIN